MSKAAVSLPFSSPNYSHHPSNGTEEEESYTEEPFSSPTSSGYSSSRDAIPSECRQHQDLQKTKRRRRDKSTSFESKICAVCGDVAKNMHFGGMCCDSCKAFFRRSVQSNSFNKFQCNANEDCPIVKSKRRLCQYCRFQKCLRIGMDVGLVMSEMDRMAMWKRKLTRRREVCSQSPSGEGSSISEETDHLRENGKDQRCLSPAEVRSSKSICFRGITLEELDALKHLVTLQHVVFSSYPYPENCYGNTTETLANLFFHICQKLRSLFLRLDDFQNLHKEDQIYLLRNGIGMSIYIHGAYNYDSINQRWPAKGINESLRLPNISKETVKMFSIFPELYTQLMNFYNKYGQNIKDEAVVVLLCLIALFHERNENLIAGEHIAKLSNRYIALLKNYLVSKNGHEEGHFLLSQLLRSLFDIKKIVSFHNKVDVKPSIQPNSNPTNGVALLQSPVVALSEILEGKHFGNFPEHASAFSLEEKVNFQLSQQQLEQSFRRPQPYPDPRPDICQPFFHHPLTNAIFGSQTCTDKIFSLASALKQNGYHVAGKKCLGLTFRKNVEEGVTKNHEEGEKSDKT